VRSSYMHADRVIEAAISTAKNLLWQNARSTHSLPDGATVARVRELVHSPSVRSALEKSSDMLPAFALREAEFLVTNQSLTDHQIITRLWDVLDDMNLNQVLGVPPNSRMTPSPKER
jgi:hypothetical protein